MADIRVSPDSSLPAGDRRLLIFRVAAGVAGVALVYSLVVGCLLAVNYRQLQQSDPLNSTVLDRLRQQYARESDNPELVREIRELDLLARRAYFTGRQQIRVGVRLLVAGLVVLLAALQVLVMLTPGLPRPATCSGIDNPFQVSVAARRCLVGGCALLLAMIVFLGLLLPDAGFSQPKVSGRECGKARTPAGTPPAAELIPSRDELAANWPNFRGLDGNGVTVRKGVLLAWDGRSGKNIRWKTLVAKPGFSSPIVWGDRVFVSGGDRKIRRVFAFAAGDGRLLWQRDVCGIRGSPSTPPEVSGDTGYAAATMATDGKHVFAIFATGDLVAYGVDGREAWGINLGVPDNHYGHSSSLIMYRDLLLVQYDQADRSRLIAIAAGSGKIAWQQNRKAGISWASPLLVDLDGQSLVVLVSSSVVTANSLPDGREVWRVECMGGEVAPSPAHAAGRVFVAADGGTAAAIDARTGRLLWRNDEIDLPDVASPLAVNGILLLATSTGLVEALDSRTGKLLWTREFPGGFYSSPVLVGDNVFLTDRKGVTIVFKAASEYREVSRSELGCPVVTTPAFAGRRMYLRGYRYLYCIGGADE